jgi:hypothetical protein
MKDKLLFIALMILFFGIVGSISGFVVENFLYTVVGGFLVGSGVMAVVILKKEL